MVPTVPSVLWRRPCSSPARCRHRRTGPRWPGWISMWSAGSYGARTPERVCSTAPRVEVYQRTWLYDVNSLMCMFPAWGQDQAEIRH
eukprot:8663827-Lingulodinium_polyedra.AAC.1